MIKVCHLSSVTIDLTQESFYKQCQSLASDNRLVSLVIADGLGNENKDNISIFDVGKQKIDIEEYLKRLMMFIKKH